jgi:hypothetical protein
MKKLKVVFIASFAATSKQELDKDHYSMHEHVVRN